MTLLRFYFPGIALILAAVFILAFPGILVAMVSALILITGFFALAIGHAIRKSEVKLNKMDETSQSSGWHRYCFLKSDRIIW
jgi:multisubunit Na+/H+ antiporter MnhG subunit